MKIEHLPVHKYVTKLMEIVDCRKGSEDELYKISRFALAIEVANMLCGGEGCMHRCGTELPCEAMQHIIRTMVYSMDNQPVELQVRHKTYVEIMYEHVEANYS